MAEASIPVELANPGQVFACLGFLEAADVLLGEAEGGFDWSDEADVRFRLSASGTESPVASVLEFLASADVKQFGPVGYSESKPKVGNKDDVEEDDGDADEKDSILLELTETFCAREGDRMVLPIRLGGGNRPIIELSHWADGSSRQSFKLYSGNRSAHKIARDMLKGARKKPSKRQKQRGESGDLRTMGVVQLLDENRQKLISEPFDVLTPMGGNFNFDPRGAWTAINVGYSPNDQKPKHLVTASPIVELLAAWGLENARPVLLSNGEVRYSAWGVLLPPVLARVALIGGIPALSLKHFRFALESSGKNKIVTFAAQESNL